MAYEKEAYIPKDGTGTLFKNDKGDNPARPDYRGDAMINGEHVEISAWIKPMASDPSKRYMSLSFQPKRQQQAAPAKKAQSTGGGSRQNRTDDDQIPF